MSVNKAYKDAFGEALDNQLRKKNVTQGDLARTIGKSPTYLNHVMAGRKMPLYDLVDSVVEELGLTAEEELMLHRAAARAHRKHDKENS